MPKLHDFHRNWRLEIFFELTFWNYSVVVLLHTSLNNHAYVCVCAHCQIKTLTISEQKCTTVKVTGHGAFLEK